MEYELKTKTLKHVITVDDSDTEGEGKEETAQIKKETNVDTFKEDKLVKSESSQLKRRVLTLLERFNFIMDKFESGSRLTKEIRRHINILENNFSKK